MRSEDFRADKARPFTGAEYLESLRDGREVYISSERIADVTTHPAMRNSARSLARLYDVLHDPKRRDTLTSATDTGSAATRIFSASPNPLVSSPPSRRDRRVVAHVYGWMGRTVQAACEHVGQRRLVWAVQGQRFLAQTCPGSRAVHEPRHRQPADRPPQAGRAMKDVFVHHQETDAGIRLRRQVVATSSALRTTISWRRVHGTGIRRRVSRDRAGTRCAASQSSANTSTIRCRRASTRTTPSWCSTMCSSLGGRAGAARCPEILSFHPASGFMHSYCFKGCTLRRQLDFLAGLLAKALRATGGVPSAAARLRRVIALSTCSGVFNAMAYNPIPWANGAVLPSLKRGLPHLHVGSLSASSTPCAG